MGGRLLIIQPSFYRSQKDRRVATARKRDLVPLVLPYLAALTPPDWHVQLVDEMLTPVDLEAPADVVALTSCTLNSFRAYDLAAEYRRRGKVVLIGGPHGFFYPEEAREHCDAVAIGEGELLWSRMLADAAAGRLRAEYKSETQSDLKGLPLPRYDLLDMRPYGRFKAFAVQATRGCPFVCDFCSERLYLGGGFRCRPVPDVVAEIKHARSRHIFFAESNFGGNPSYAMELMEAIAPLKLRWSTLWSLNLCTNRHFMDLAQKSGLLHVNIGMESLDPETIAAMKKRQNAPSKYSEILRDLRRRGISFSLNFMFGWDTDTPDVFEATREFLRQEKVPVAYFNVLTPDRGTQFHERMLQEKRILNPEQMGRWPGQTCHIRPRFCTPAELEDQVRTLYREFYTLPSMLSRLPLPLTQSNIASWLLNFTQRRMARTMLNFGNY